MLQHFGPHMNKGGAAVSLTYLASERIVPGASHGHEAIRLFHSIPLIFAGVPSMWASWLAGLLS